MEEGVMGIFDKGGEVTISDEGWLEIGYGEGISTETI